MSTIRAHLQRFQALQFAEDGFRQLGDFVVGDISEKKKKSN